jgi:hypothetical protein
MVFNAAIILDNEQMRETRHWLMQSLVLQQIAFGELQKEIVATPPLGVCTAQLRNRTRSSYQIPLEV